MTVARIVLEYLQVLVWPALIAWVVWRFRDELRGLPARIESMAMGPLKVELREVEQRLEATAARVEVTAARVEGVVATVQAFAHGSIELGGTPGRN